MIGQCLEGISATCPKFHLESNEETLMCDLTWHARMYFCFLNARCYLSNYLTTYIMLHQIILLTSRCHEYCVNNLRIV